MKRRADVVFSTAVPPVGFHEVIGTFRSNAHRPDSQRCQSSDLKGERRFLFGSKQDLCCAGLDGQMISSECKKKSLGICPGSRLDQDANSNSSGRSKTESDCVPR